MEPVFNERKLRGWLEPLSKRHKLAFAIACCERQPGLEGALEAAWSRLADRAGDAAPLSPNPVSTDQTRATDLEVSLLQQAFDFAGDVTRLVIEIAALANEAAEARAEAELGPAGDDPEHERRLTGHPLVQQELKRQREDIKLLLRTPIDSPEDVAAFRATRAQTP
jgi:hypothetical protein